MKIWIPWTWPIIKASAVNASCHLSAWYGNTSISCHSLTHWATEYSFNASTAHIYVSIAFIYCSFIHSSAIHIHNSATVNTYVCSSAFYVRSYSRTATDYIRNRRIILNCYIGFSCYFRTAVHTSTEHSWIIIILRAVLYGIFTVYRSSNYNMSIAVYRRIPAAAVNATITSAKKCQIGTLCSIPNRIASKNINWLCHGQTFTHYKRISAGKYSVRLFIHARCSLCNKLQFFKFYRTANP